jgi:uncharacterized iron-regulated protein
MIYANPNRQQVFLMITKNSILSVSLMLMIAASTARSAEHHQSPQTPVAGNHAHQENNQASAKHDEEESIQSSVVVELKKAPGFNELIPKLLSKQLILIGETHTNYGHHLNQLEIIRRIHAEFPDIAIGMEMFQQPYQPQLDAFIKGDLSESKLIGESGWYKRWGYDYRLYRPVLDFALKNHIPVVALNISTEMKERVSEVGLEGLDEQERQQLPAEIDRSDQAYEQRLRKIYDQHPQMKKEDFDRFVDVQLLWDESMAAQAAAWLQAHPGKKMILLAGSGHLIFGSGIPNRVTRRTPVDSAIVLPADGLEVTREIADFVIYPPAAALPKAGLMGLYLEDVDNGVKISGLGGNSSAAKAGVKQDDVIQMLNGKKIATLSDIKIELLDKPPGEEVSLGVSRKGVLWGDKMQEFTFELGGF